MSISQRGNSSLPAGTGVWVVKTLSLRVFARAFLKVMPGGDQFTRPLEGQEGGVRLVHVPDGRVEIQCPQGTHAADSQQHFLGHAQVEIAPVEAGGQFAVVGGILVQVAIEQVERDAPDAQFPDGGADRPVGEIDA